MLSVERELAEWSIAVSLKLIQFKKLHPFESDILCKDAAFVLSEQCTGTGAAAPASAAAAL